MNVKIKRVYEQPAEADGMRILVDRLWPRGLSKQKAQVDLWLKEIAPSDELRRWFAHDTTRWAEFQKRYRDELKHNKSSMNVLKEAVAKGPATLLYGAKDEQHNQAVILLKMLDR